MSHVQRCLIRISLAAALVGTGHPILAVDLAPGDNVLVRTVIAEHQFSERAASVSHPHDHVAAVRS